MRPLTVGEVMTQDLVTSRPGDRLLDVRDRIHEKRIRHVPVVDGQDRLVGLVTHRDLLRNTLVERKGVSGYVEDSLLEEMTVEEIMTRDPEVVDPGTDIREAARIMLREKYGCLPVVEGGRLVGILTEADFLKVVLYED